MRAVRASATDEERSLMPDLYRPLINRELGLGGEGGRGFAGSILAVMPVHVPEPRPTLPGLRAR